MFIRNGDDETIDTEKRQIHVVGTYMPKLKKLLEVVSQNLYTPNKYIKFVKNTN